MEKAINVSPGIILTIVVALFPLTGRAQLQGAFDNTYMSVKAGPNYYWNHAVGAMGVGIDVDYGKWIINTFSLRGQISALFSNERRSQLYCYAHADALYDMVASFSGKRRGNFRSYVICGIGFLNNLDKDYDCCLSVGLGGDVGVGGKWLMSCELKTMIIPSSFDEVMEPSILPTIMVGMVREINSNHNRIRTRRETRSFGNDWFVQIAAGVSSLNYNGLGGMEERLSLLTPIAECGLGKNISKTWSGRFNLSGFYCKSKKELFSYYNIRGDMIMSLAGFLFPNVRTTSFDIKPYFGVSLLTRLDDQSNFQLGTALGMMFTLKPMGNNEIYMDVRYVMTSKRFVHEHVNQTTLSVGMATVSIGYSYFFSKRSF